MSLILNWGLGVITFILWALHFWTGIPLILSQIGFGLWLIAALFVAILMALGAKSGEDPPKQTENRNPYSAKNTDFPGFDKFYQEDTNLQNTEKARKFLDKLCEAGYISYQSQNSMCGEIAIELSKTALKQNLPPIPSGLIEPHPTAPNGGPEILGIAAAAYIAGKITGWRVFLIDLGEKSNGYYIGAVSNENAGAFESEFSACFSGPDSNFKLLN